MLHCWLPSLYAFSLNAINAYHWVLFHRPSPPDSP